MPRSFMLSAFETAFVRLAADAALRARFEASPADALAAFDLTERERRALLGLDRRALARFAGSLLAKRVHELERALPLTLRVAPSVARRYRRWLETHPAPPTDGVLDPGVAEALRALAPLGAALRGDEGEAAYAADVLGFEVLARASAADGQVRRWRAAYRADRLVAELRQGVLPLDPEPAPTLFRFAADGARHRPAGPAS